LVDYARGAAVVVVLTNVAGLRMNSMPVDDARSRAPNGATTRWPWAAALLGLLADLLTRTRFHQGIPP
jgi:hypothetical protein